MMMMMMMMMMIKVFSIQNYRILKVISRALFPQQFQNELNEVSFEVRCHF